MTSANDKASIPLAIIGMACRLPDADNLEEYWKLLIEGRSAIRELPADRLDQDLYYDPRKGIRGKTYSKLGGVISSKEVDWQTCPIPRDLAQSVDIAHVLMCDVAAGALRHAGLDPLNLPLRNTGVFIGHAQGSSLSSDYTYASGIEEAAQFLREVDEFQQLPPADQEAVIDGLIGTVRGQHPHLTADAPDTSTNMIAGTISRAFGLTGPYVALNSACASSLQALLLAARALQFGRVDMAVAGGASDCKGDSLVLFSIAQSMSATGSRPFDADADGLICSEGYVALVLKTLERAVADGDRVLAVIRGLGISSDGRGKSLWAPRKEGQIKAMERAYRTGVEMSGLQYIEAHATATQLGDATELNTLAEVLADKLPPGKKIPVTSVKANIGHSLEAAGIAGVIKVILAMHHGMIPPAINIRRLNPKIDWENLPVYVPQQPTPWPAPADGTPRRAGVNAFGIGGLNMHVVLDQYTESARQLIGRPAAADPSQKAATGDTDAVAIIGRACIFPGAKDLAGFWELLISARDPKSHATPDRWRTDLCYKPGSCEPFRSPATLGGFITDFQYDWRTHKVPPKQVEQADPLQFMLLEAADQALKEAGYDQRLFDRSRVGVVVGTEFGGDFAVQLQMGLRLPHMGRVIRNILTRQGVRPEQAARIDEEFAEALLRHWPALIDESGSFSTSSLASRITKSWDLMGGAAALDAGGTSSLASLAASVDMLLAGDVDMMVCAAGQRRMGLEAYETLALAGVLATDPKPRSPFDTQANGYVPGEGVGVLILKRLSDAQRDGDPIHGIIRGIGGGHHESPADAIRLAVQRSLADASVQGEDLALIDTDGFSLPWLDDEHARTLVELCKGQGRPEPLQLGTVVGQIGHTGGASGMATLLKASLEVEHGEIVPTVGLETPVPAIAQSASTLQAATCRTPLRHATADGRRLAGVSGCAKGLAYHVVLEKGSKVPVSERNHLASSTDSVQWRIFRLGAANPRQFFQRLTEAAADGQAQFAASPATRFTAAERVRLAIVAENPAALAQKLQTAVKQLATPSVRPLLEQQGIFYRQLGPRPPRIAFVFSGQGSQYTKMLKELVAEVPAAATAMREADAVMARLGYLTFAQMAWDETAPIGTDIWLTQASVLLADRIMLAALADRGIRPDVVLGHSYGEYVALMAAGVWDFAETVRVTRARCEAIESTPSTRGAMLATTAPPEIINQLAKRFGRPLFIANHNAPDQTVVAGQQQIIEDFAAVVVRESFQARLLAVPCPFHTPIMQDAAVALERSLAGFPIGQPRVPMLSVVTNEYVEDPEEVRANLVAHMTHPVRYVDLIRRIVAEDHTVLVEVGPNQFLTGLHRRILDGYNISVIASDNVKRPGRVQLECVQALLECAGALDQEAPAVSAGRVARPATQVAPEAPEVLHFDATARRREKMRTAATSQPAREALQTPASVKASPERLPERFQRPAVPDGSGNGPTKRPAQPAGRSSPVDRLTPYEPDPLPIRPSLAEPGHAASEPGRVSPEAPPAARSTDRAPVSTTNTAELEAFLVNFVVEQTGYPAEVVELDADLEADLGIDSIKKAQLFGELQEYFDVTPTEDLTLDDFPTLRHVVNYLRGTPVNELARIGPESEPHAPAPVTEAPLPTPSKGAPSAAPVSTANAAELESFLINFVVEQTGYPPEVVELDADLEADLGIDSIKKAQLFGELQEYFDVTPTEELTLDDFPTLRHVVNFLLGAPLTQGEATVQAPAQDAEPARGYPFPAADQPSAGGPRTSSADVASAAVVARLRDGILPAELHVLRLSGTRYEIGLAHGQQQRQQIRQILRHYADLAGAAWDELPIPAAARQDPQALFTEDELAELQGLADGADVALGNLLAHNLAMLSELGSSAMHLAVSAARNPGAVLMHGICEEPPLNAPLRECLMPVVQVRMPANGIPHAVLSAAGTIGAWGGINAAGLAITVNIAWDRQGRDNVAGRASLISEVLAAAADVDAAVEVLRRLHGQESWVACVSHSPSDRVVYATADRDSFHTRDGDATVLSSPSSGASLDGRRRLERLASLLAITEKPGLTAASLQTAFRSGSLDTCEGEPRRFFPGKTRVPSEPIGFVFDARARELWISPGYPAGDSSTGFYRLSVDELLPSGDWATSQHEPPAPASGDESTHRFVLKTVESPFNPTVSDAPAWHGSALVVGRNPSADALRRRLRQEGVVVRELALADDLDTTLRAFDDLWRQEPILHLFLFSPRDEDLPDLGDEAGWRERRYRNVMLPYFLCQRWLELAGEAKLLNHCTLVVGLALGGDFGFSSPVAVPECGALTGLVKSLCIEFVIMRGYRDLLVKTIDAPRDEPEELLVANIFRELASATMDYEVAFVGGKRYVQNAMPEDAPVEPEVDIRPRAVWVATGGARGITAACALELGRRFGLRLHLIGASPRPEIEPSWLNLSEDGLKALKASTIIQARNAHQSPTEAWSRVEKAIEIERSLQTFAAEGIQATYHCCDVADRRALAEVLDKIRQIDGPIEGIIHGAGIDHACRYEKKRRELVEATFGAKVDGAYHLMTLTRQDPVRHFIGFGSVSGRMGGNGQTDYAAASDMLCKLIGWYRTVRPECHAVGIHYHPWDEVGMAVKPETRAVLEMADAPAFMPKREGLQHLLRELYAGTPRSEILITDWDYYQRFYGAAFLDAFEPEPAESSQPPEGRVAKRHVLRMFDAPLDEQSPEMPTIDGPVMILGQNQAGQALCRRLVDHGATVHMLPASEQASDVIAALERLWASQPARYLFLMTGRDEGISHVLSQEAWEERKWAIDVPYLVTQRWFQLLLTLPDQQRGTLVAVTNLGGDFGFEETAVAPEGGMLTGLLKSLYVEDTRRAQSRIRLKVIDAPAGEDPHDLAAAVCRELASDRPEVEAAWSQGRRRVVRAMAQPIEGFRRIDPAHGRNWVITGGARGITAAVAYELGRRFGMRLHLIGRTAEPREDAPWRHYNDAEMKALKASIVHEAVAAGRSPEEEWDHIRCDIEIYDNLKRMTEAGIKVAYHCCDVTDWDALSRVLQRVREMDGPIQGIVHGAGYARTSRFETIRPDRFYRTVRPKTDGTMALMTLTRRDPLHYFIAFGSLSGRYGGNGLSDYAAANDYLAKLLDWYRHQRPEVASACFHWQTWDRIGMAMISDNVGINKNHLKMPFIPPEEGVEHLIEELRAALPETEVLITDGYFHSTFYPQEAGVPVGEADVPTKTYPLDPQEERQRCERPVIMPPAPTDIARPLIAAVQPLESGGLVAEIQFDPTQDPFLVEHRLKGKPFLPGVVMLESLAEAASLAAGEGEVISLSGVEIVNGLMFHTERPVMAKVTVTPTADGFACVLTSELRDRKDRLIHTDRLLARGTVQLDDTPAALVAPLPGEPAHGWFEHYYPSDVLMYHGNPLRVLKEYCCQYDGAFARIVAPSPQGLAGSRPVSGWLLPMAALDGCVYCCGNFIYIQFAKALEVPYGFDRLQLGRPPRDDEGCVLRLFFRGREGRHSRFDFTLFGDDGSVILAAEGYRTVLVGEGGP